MMADISVAALLRERASSEQRIFLDEAARTARRLQMPVFLVGGAVRDLLLTGRFRDLDLAVEGDGVEFASNLAHGLGATLHTHDRFLTAEISTPGGRIDVVTARSEVYAEPAALPLITPASLHEDLFRRDFTVNAMAVPLWPGADSELIDPFGGRRDLERRTLRILHDRSFFDDPTRILRGARLATRLDLEFAAETNGLAAAAVATRAFDPLSADRLRQEVVLMLEDADPPASLEWLDGLGFHAVLERSEPFTRLDLQTLRALIDRRAESRTVAAWSALRVRWWLAYLMGLSLEASASSRAALAVRLGFDDGLTEVFTRVRERLREASRRLVVPRVLPEAVGRAVGALSDEEIVVLGATASLQVSAILDRWLTEWSPLRLSIDGQDLLDAGFAPGPAIGRALAETLEARREGRIGTAQELDFAIDRLREGKGARE